VREGVFMRDYDPKVLRKLQLFELKILKDFDALCKKNNLAYFLFFGCGIGALRHGGFIPWDDDIDVIMLRQDYNRFLQIAKVENNDKYCLINAKTDPNYPTMTTSFGKKKTRLITDTFKSTNDRGMICIDLFPLDNISDDPVKKRRQEGIAWFWNKLMILRQLSSPNVPFYGFQKTFIQFLCKTIHLGMKLFHISPEWIYKKCYEACVQYENTTTQKVAFLTDTKPGMDVFSMTELFPPRYLEFEGILLPFPNQLEVLLTRLYGDYMQLPPEKERRNHFPELLDFGDGERYENGESI